MAATEARSNISERSDDYMTLPMANNSAIHGWTLVAVDSTGKAVMAEDDDTLTVMGIAAESKVNPDGGTETITIKLSCGCRSFPFKNSESAAVGPDDIGKPCYVEDNETVTMLSAGSCVAGTVTGVDSSNVWVRFAL